MKIITVCHDLQYAQPLIRSLVRNRVDYVAIEAPWQGFGTKLIRTYEYLKQHPEVESFVFCDAFDCDERWRKQVCSRGCEEEDANVREENKWRL